ncbi:hypothetical protein Neosp_014063 [[Neocosmospora] mangrovei]
MTSSQNRWALTAQDIEAFVHRSLEYGKGDICIGRIVHNMQQPKRSRIHEIPLETTDISVTTERDFEVLWSTNRSTSISWQFLGWGGDILRRASRCDLIVKTPFLHRHRAPREEIMHRIFPDHGQLHDELARPRLDAFLEGRELYVITGYDIIVNPFIQFHISERKNHNMPTTDGFATGVQPSLGDPELGNATPTVGEITMEGEFVWFIEFVPIIFTSTTGFKFGEPRNHLILDKTNDSMKTGIILQAN